MTIEEIIFNSLLPDRQLLLEMSIREGKMEAEGWRYRKHGSRFWCNAIIPPVYQDGAHTGFSKVTRDLTKAKGCRTAPHQGVRGELGAQICLHAIATRFGHRCMACSRHAPSLWRAHSDRQPARSRKHRRRVRPGSATKHR